MKKMILTLCLIVLTMANVLSQNSDGDSCIPIDSGYVNVDGGKLFYESAGKGENIVLLHDGIVNREIWDEQFLVLAKYYRVIRYDRRSYGKSSDPQAPYSHVDDLYQLFVQLKIDKAVIFGMSAGGRITIDFTLKYPEKVRGLVLIGAAISGFSYSSHMSTRGGHISSPAEVSAPDKFIKYYGWDDPYQVYPENVKAKEKVWKLLQTKPHIGRDKGEFQKPADRLAVRFLSEIKVPTLILTGEFDIPDNHATSGALQAGILNSKREIILKAGHLIPIEQPEAFNKIVLDFLKTK